jgi:ABC-type transport system involved in multi-copper enzyme maturation permease subunit
MRTIWHSLVWKEWHEHKWKLAAIFAIMASLLWMPLLDDRREYLFVVIQWTIMVSVIPAALFVGMSVAAGERSRGTLPFLLALPVPPRQVARMKLAFGLTTCLGPALVAIVLLLCWYHWRSSQGIDYEFALEFAWIQMGRPFGLENWFLGFAVLVTLWAVSLFLWTAAAGVDRPDEVSAGAVALSVTAGVWILLWAARMAHEPFTAWLDRDGAWLAALAQAAAPYGLVNVRLEELSPAVRVAALVVFAAVHGGLAAWYVRRFGRVADRQIRSPQSAVRDAAQPDWLAPPRRTPWIAITWKQFRESGPIALVGLSGALAIGAGSVVVAYRTNTRPTDTSEYPAMFLLVSFFAAIYLGAISTLVIGIGVFLRDLEPRLGTFWRSRPISADAWYWIKFATGLVVVLVAFQLPMLLVAAAAPAVGLGGDFEGRSDVLEVQRISLIVFVSVYAAAVAATCLVRNAVYAAILAIGAQWAGAMAAAAVVFGVCKLVGRELPPTYLDGPEGVNVWLAGCVAVAVVGTVLGWLAVRYDWGRKSRY